MKLSPMMQEYMKTKQEYPDCILFYRLGDFYEMFFDDAIVASKELELVLTSKACGKNDKAPMCGIPYHSAEIYISKLVEKGYKVAVAEQILETPGAKGLVKREVVKIVTPGTIIGSDITSIKDNNYLVAICVDNDIDVSWCDFSTGDLLTEKFNDGLKEEKTIELIKKINPREIVANFDKRTFLELWKYQELSKKFIITDISGRVLGAKNATDLLLGYLKYTQKQDIEHLKQVETVKNNKMILDESTLRGLEITETMMERSVQGSLFGILDKCKTAMGSRKLKQWIKEPLIDCDEIQKRLDGVGQLFDNEISRNNIRTLLNGVYDIERLISKISMGTANAKDLIALKQSINVLNDVKLELSEYEDVYLSEINERIDSLTDVYNMIESSILEEAPNSIRDGEMIKKGYSEELDEMNEKIKDSKKWLKDLEGNERKRTGIKNLKVGYNKVFGYYIEVSKSQLGLVPQEYIRKQTLVNGERFYTVELKDVETLLLTAQVQINELEYKIFTEIRNFVKTKTKVIQETAVALSELDVLCSFAEVSTKNFYNKPKITDGYEIKIKNGRHPVIEKMMTDTLFIPNDMKIDLENSSFLLITGPNMAGKSTYMRQNALIIIMAQAGCFVPADDAIIGVCDGIFTRIGASDNISLGQSTFFVEMLELAHIINQSTEKSFIIIDEIGRGTNTLDGLSIAWAVVEQLTMKEKRRTMFATHFHELTDLEKIIKGIKNLNVDIIEENNEIMFKYKVTDGTASKSYGINVAKLAGVPRSVIESAENKLNFLEKTQKREKINTEGQENQILDDLEKINVMDLKPSEAIKIIENMQEKVKKCKKTIKIVKN